MTRDHLLGFPALLRQHDEPVVPKEQTVKERPAAFVAFEKGDWAPKVTMGVDPAVEGGDKTPTMLRRAAKDAEQAAFENWCDKTRPSGDVESVQRQWMESDERAELFEADDDVFDTIRKLVTELGKPAAVNILAEFGAQKGVDLKPEQWAEFIATAERRLAGWIKWSGGEQPVADGVVVEVKHIEGVVDCDLAEDFDWQHRDRAFGDIVEYRVVVKKAKQGSISAKF